MKKGILFIVLIVSCASFVGCAADRAELSPIQLDQAKATALEASGCENDDVVFTAASLNVRNGVHYYGIDFTADGVDYEYDVDAKTGEILSFDIESEGSAAQNNGTEGIAEQKVTAKEAKQIALSKVSGAKEQDIREFETDYDDGRLEYEGKIYYNQKEYEFEIDGYSGAIRKWEVESILDE